MRDAITVYDPAIHHIPHPPRPEQGAGVPESAATSVALNSTTSDDAVDAGGMTQAAIQELNQKVESGRQEAETQIEALKAENAELKAWLEPLERLLAVEE